MTLICGLPNAGKTTYSQQFENVIHSDDVAGKVSGLIAESDGNICVEGTFLHKHSRTKVLKVCKPEWEKICIWLDTSPDECKRRENRGRKPWLIDNCVACLQPPTYDEGWDEIIVIKG